MPGSSGSMSRSSGAMTLASSRGLWCERALPPSARPPPPAPPPTPPAPPPPAAPSVVRHSSLWVRYSPGCTRRRVPPGVSDAASTLSSSSSAAEKVERGRGLCRRAVTSDGKTSNCTMVFLRNDSCGSRVVIAASTDLGMLMCGPSDSSSSIAIDGPRDTERSVGEYDRLVLCAERSPMCARDFVCCVT